MSRDRVIAKNALHIDDLFAIDWDKYQWILYTWPHGKYNEKGKLKSCSSLNIHYFHKVEEMARSMVQLRLENGVCVSDIVEFVDAVHKLIKVQEECLKAFGLEKVRDKNLTETGD